ncbi:hypothetical protein GGR51DRAFT_554794 [Nemania sp. FL0031]|nr:hypothetical protein GGR51DRAFT_554794 [Nemania sp. FL0031]
MPHRSSYRPRPSRHHVHGSQSSRRHRRHRHEDGARHVVEDNQPQDGDIADDSFDNPSPEWMNSSWAGSGPAVSYTNDSIHSTHTSSDLMMAVDDGALDGGQYESHFTSRGPTWDEQHTFYQHTPHDWTQNSMLPDTSSQMDEAPPGIPETNFDRSVPTPSWGYQTGQSWASSASQDQTAEAEMSYRIRRLSTRARQGSTVIHGEGYDNNAFTANSTDQPCVRDHDSSDSSGGTSPVNREEYVHVFVNSEDIPWSSEDLRRWHY